MSLQFCFFCCYWIFSTKGLSRNKCIFPRYQVQPILDNLRQIAACQPPYIGFILVPRLEPENILLEATASREMAVGEAVASQIPFPSGAQERGMGLDKSSFSLSCQQWVQPGNAHPAAPAARVLPDEAKASEARASKTAFPCSAWERECLCATLCIIIVIVKV